MKMMQKRLRGQRIDKTATKPNRCLLLLMSSTLTNVILFIECDPMNLYKCYIGHTDTGTTSRLSFLDLFRPIAELSNPKKSLSFAHSSEYSLRVFKPAI